MQSKTVERVPTLTSRKQLIRANILQGNFLKVLTADRNKHIKHTVAISSVLNLPINGSVEVHVKHLKVLVSRG